MGEGRLKLSRRRLLAGALAGLPLARCGGGPRRRITGSLVGGSAALGHRLREGFRPEVASAESTGIVIVGAGIAGLSAAWALERAGMRDFLLLELEPVPGGTARSGTGPVVPYPWGAHYVPVPSPSNRPMTALLAEVGAVEGRDAGGRPVYAESVLCRDPEERVFYRGEWYEGLYPRVGASRAELDELAAFEVAMREAAAFRDGQGLRGYAIPRSAGSDDPRIREADGTSMAAWLDARGFRSERLRWFVEYACRDDFGATLAQTSAWAGIHYFASRLEDPAGEAAAFLTWPEGNGRLVRHLAGLAGDRLRTGCLVTDLEPTESGVDVVYEDAARGRGVVVRARHGILAAPRFLARHLVAPWRDDPPSFLAEAMYGSWMVANLTLRDRPATRGFPLSWDNVMYASSSLGYVNATHQAGIDRGPTVLTYYLPMLDDDPREGRTRLLARRWEDWVEEIVADLRPSHPGIEELIETIDVYRWGHAMVRPRPGYLWSEALAASAAPVGRLRFAHTDLSGMALFEEAQHWGIRAAESILAEEGCAFESWLAPAGGTS